MTRDGTAVPEGKEDDQIELMNNLFPEFSKKDDPRKSMQSVNMSPIQDDDEDRIQPEFNFGSDDESVDKTTTSVAKMKDISNEKPKKKRRGATGAIMDEEIEIEKSVYEKQIKNPNEILRELKQVPKTKEQLREGNKRTIEGLFKYPIIDLPEVSNGVYEEIITKVKKISEKSSMEIETNRDNQKESTRNDEDNIPPEFGGNEDDEEGFGLFEPIQRDEDEKISEIKDTPKKTELSNIKETSLNITTISEKPVSERKKKKKQLNEEEKEENDKKKKEFKELSIKYKSKGVTERTIKVLSLLNETFNETKEDDLSLESMLKGRKATVAAKTFFEILVLTSKDLIDVYQEKPYNDIIIKKTDEF
jgi:cohesin complex subunit SCC1